VKRSRRVVGLGVAVILVAAGCSGDGDSTAEPSTTTTRPAVDDSAYEALPVATIAPVPGTGQAQPTWFLRADPIGDGAELRVVLALQEPCLQLSGVDVVESEDVVTLTASTWWHPTVDCTWQPEWYRIAVPLAEPLGDRTILDGAPELAGSGGRIPEADGELFQVRAQPFDLALVTPDRRAVWVSWSGGACDVLDRVDVTHDGDTAYLEVFVGAESEQQVCTLQLVQWWTLVDLDDPATDVLDGAADADADGVERTPTG
jgi:hypothetical protein